MAALEFKPPRVFRISSAEHVVCCVFFPTRVFAVAELNHRVFVHEFDKNMLPNFRRGSVCSMDMTVNVRFRRRLRSDIKTRVSSNLVCAVATSFFED